MPGLSFDRVADLYDRTRGGTVRGDRFAATLAPWMIGPRVVELGVGTGVIAAGLGRHGDSVVGVDLSEAMLRAAVDRIGAAVAVADADELPFPTGSVDTAFFAWVLQLVDDPSVTLAEAARVVRPGGRVVAIAADPEHRPGDEFGEILSGLAPLTRPGRSGASIASAAGAPLELEMHAFTPWEEFEEAPAERIDMIERRAYSSLFDVDAATWAAVVEPVLARLRALPDPSLPRPRTTRHPLLVWRNRR